MKYSLSILTLLFLLAASPLPASTIRVPDDFETIQDAIDASDEGDTVLVAAGEYAEHIDFDGHAITLLSESGPAETIIDGSGDDTCVRFVSGEGRDSVIEGFSVTVGVAGGDGYGGGILIERSSPVVRNCVIVGNSAEQGGGGISVSFDGCDPLIERNVISENDTEGGGGGVSFYESAGHLVNNTIAYNLAGTGGSGVNIPFTDGVVVVNNIIAYNFDGGISGWQQANATVAFNDVYDNDGGNYSNVEAGNGSISVDPLFVDLNAFDVHLTEDSPCIDAGDPESPDDPDGTRADMGAFYFRQDNEDAPIVISEIPDLTVGEDCGLVEIADLDTVFSNPIEGELTFEAFGSELLNFVINDDNILSINPSENFNGDGLECSVTADNGEGITRDEFIVTVNPVNDAPLQFDPISPADTAEFLGMSADIPFAWRSSTDPDGDSLHYYIEIYYKRDEELRWMWLGPFSDTTAIISTGEFLDSLHVLPPEQNRVGINWSALVTDGEEFVYNTRSSGFILLFPESVDKSDLKPSSFTLQPLSPNPFNSRATVSFSLDRQSDVSLTVSDLIGRPVADLFNGSLQSGNHTAVWDAALLPAGTYVVKLSSHYQSRSVLAQLLK